MPLIVFQKVAPQTYLAVWKIEEGVETLDSLLGDYPMSDPRPISKVPSVLSQWLATRICLKLLLQSPFLLMKTENGSPYIYKSDWNLSLTHTKGWAAVCISKNSCGIDIELMSNRAEKIADRFINGSEWELCPGETKPEKMLWLWCAKEAGFKLYGKGQVIFKEDLLVKKDLSVNGCILQNVLLGEDYRLFFKKVNELIIVWALGTNDS